MKGIAKYMTLAILAIAFIIGCIGPFVKVFEMVKYTDFLKAFAPWYMSLIASIGANAVAKTVKEK